MTYFKPKIIQICPERIYSHHYNLKVGFYAAGSDKLYSGLLVLVALSPETLTYGKAGL